MARIGNTQGIRFSSRPPSRAPNRAMTKVVEEGAFRSAGGAAVAVAALAALAVSAA
jgi:hypothetical protein